MTVEKIQDILLKDEMKSSYIDYAMSVVIGRAIPDVRDGLKPVHRRIIYAMADNNWYYTSSHVKCAKIVGECFIEGTLINTINGFKTIETVSVGDKVHTHNGIKEVTQMYEMPENKLYQIELENGLQNICTKGQKFKIFTSELKFVWKTPEELKIGDYIVCRSKHSSLNKLIQIGDLYFDEELAYFIGIFLADGWIDRDNKRGYHRIAISSESLKVMEKIQAILINKFNQQENILQRKSGIYYIRINNHELNKKLITLFNLEDKYSHNIIIPSYVYNSPKNIILAFFSGFLEGDGHIHRNRSILNINTISEKFIREIQVILFSIGINSSLYLNKVKSHYLKGKLIKANYDVFSLEVAGIDFFNIRDKIKIFNPKKLKNLIKQRRYTASKYEEIPYIGKYIFEEFSEKHLGGGWYLDKYGKKVRLGIKYPDGTKLRYSKNLKDNIRIYKSTLEILNIKEKMEVIGSAYLDIINNIIKHNLSFIKIKELRKINPKRTYDIQVKDDHQFIANGMIVHNCLGNYHPHGDSSVYNALVRMAQDFSLRYPLIDPQGNFGSIDGDPPAAYRYTEARLSQIANELIEDLDKDTVEFQPNFDDSTSEPRYLPSKLPNMLLNGTKGIAVGMATSMPPHNLIEICTGIIATIDNPDVSIEELIEIIKGPDFPTGGIITSQSGIYNAYSTGQGTITIQGRTEVEIKGNSTNLVITEIPYLVNKTDLIESIAKLIKDGVLKDIKDLRDESDRKGMRIVLELKKNAQPVILKNILFTRTRLLTSFPTTNLVLINNGKQPKILNLKELIEEYINHRLDVVYKRTQFTLLKSQDRLHKVEGLIIALNNIDDVVKIIKNAKDTDEAKIKLMDTYEISEIQVKAILNMPLSRLTSLEQQKLKDEQKELNEQIKEYERILKSKQERLEIIKTELTELSKKYGDKRRTEISEEPRKIENIEEKDLIKKEPTIVILTENHYIKRMSLEEYRTQKRGGRGKKGITVGEEDFIADLFVCSTHDTILFFMSKGRAYSMKAFEIPLQKRSAKGKPIINLLALQEDEKIADMIPINNFNTSEMLIMTTKNGIIKKCSLRLFSKIKKNGLRAQKIRPDDELVSVKKISNELQDIFIATKLGYAIRFDESELRELGRNTMGVKGAELREGDEVI
ncbi:MAG: DNA topoisomerase 4 subunit A, partial [Promethearchaeota archaeon]